MNADRIKEIQLATAYPESVSVYSALLKVWNECQQEFNARTEQPAISEKEIKEKFRTNYIYDIDCRPEAIVNCHEERNRENELRQEGARWAIQKMKGRENKINQQ
jgi:hypothetical protein